MLGMSEEGPPTATDKCRRTDLVRVAAGWDHPLEGQKGGADDIDDSTSCTHEH